MEDCDCAASIDKLADDVRPNETRCPQGENVHDRRPDASAA
jgi:hypothetical protein